VDKQKGKTLARAVDGGANLSTAADKIAGLLALIVVKDMGTDEAALKLDGIGFTAREISVVLGVGTNYVNVARHRAKGVVKKKRAKDAE
jgi:hypothetical protein